MAAPGSPAAGAPAAGLPTVAGLARQLAEGRTSALALAEAALARIAQCEAAQGQAVFIASYGERAMDAARAADARRAAGAARSPIDGLPISVKDLFDVAGECTRAGSKRLDLGPPAAAHAVVVQRLLAAGAVLVGRTNMTEFAFSGIGMNPHYGSPRNPWDEGRITGGSSSGAAASVAGGMAVAAIGSDTGGSVRIPAALCGLTGFKPTASRIPMDGMLPLSPSLDSVGPLAASVGCCAILDGVMAGQALALAPAPGLRGRRFLLPANMVLDELDERVAAAFATALARIREVGAHVDEIVLPELDLLPHINRKGGLVCAEAWQWHRSAWPREAPAYDPRVLSRIRLGADVDEAEYQALQAARRAWIAAVEARLGAYDALLMPTVPQVAPRISELERSDEAYFHANRLMLRNTGMVNFLDGCALSLPCHEEGGAPVGLMVAGPRMRDAQVLEIGMALEGLFRPASC